MKIYKIFVNGKLRHKTIFEKRFWKLQKKYLDKDYEIFGNGVDYAHCTK